MSASHEKSSSSSLPRCPPARPPSCSNPFEQASVQIPAVVTASPLGKRLVSYEDSFSVPLNTDRWPMFCLLEPEFLVQIKQICVFGSAGNEAILVTKDDDVYASGSNCSSCLGLGEPLSGLEPRRIEQLCHKSVISFAYGSGPHVLALTSNGDVFSWGHNGYCQLGNGNTSQGTIPALITINLSGKRIVQVACGSHHSMALSADGEVYAWGQNNCGQVGSGTTSNQACPRKVSTSIGHRQAVWIACGQTSSLAVLDNGDVYGWGYNGNGQLGLGNNVNQPNPCRISGLQGYFITQVVCGYAHSLALSDDGELFSWGANSYGQLGTGNKANLVTPTRIGLDKGRFVDIAATHYNHLSVAVTQMGCVCMWGQCRGQSITSPLETRFQSMHDVFACFGTPPVSWKPIDVDYCESRKLPDSMRRAFDDPGTADLKFLVEGRLIYVHKALLKIRCEHFRSMFQRDWIECDKDVIEIPFYSYAVYRAFLRYLYTDLVDLPSDDALGLLDLANAYCETPLKRICEQIVKQGITCDNAAMLYAAAIKYSAPALQEFCFRFILNHMTAVTQTESFMQLDESVTKNLIRLAAQFGAFKF